MGNGSDAYAADALVMVFVFDGDGLVNQRFSSRRCRCIVGPQILAQNQGAICGGLSRVLRRRSASADLPACGLVSRTRHKVLLYAIPTTKTSVRSTFSGHGRWNYPNRIECSREPICETISAMTALQAVALRRG